MGRAELMGMRLKSMDMWDENELDGKRAYEPVALLGIKLHCSRLGKIGRAGTHHIVSEPPR
jgi:hypothetical protein